MSHPTVLFERDGNVARITLNRPEVFNALDLEMARDLADAALQCNEDPAIRAVLLQGAGKSFCGGGDLRAFHSEGENLHRYIHEVTTHLHTAISRFAHMDSPVIAAVHGSAAGAGMSLVCACDLVVAADSARFTMAYTRVGLTPDGSATYFLPRIVGIKRALDLTLTNRMLTAAEAMEWGIVARVVPANELPAVAEELARTLSRGPTLALGATKRLLQGGMTGTLETQMAIETRIIAGITGTNDGREGILAFLDKRTPDFTNS